MPVKNGYETLTEVSKLFKDHNKKAGNQKVLRPLTCYLSQTAQNVMDMFLQQDEKAELYLEKPVPMPEITSLVELLNLI